MPATAYFITGPAIIAAVRQTGLPGTGIDLNLLGTYLGWAERSPEIQWDVETEGTLNTTGGSRLGAIYTFQGAEAHVDVVISRLNLAGIEAVLFPFMGTGVAGFDMLDPTWVPGRPVGSESANIMGAWCRLFISFPYINQTLLFVRAYPRVIRWVDTGTIPSKIAIRFHCIRGNLIGAGPIQGVNVWITAVLMPGIVPFPPGEALAA